jgi:hypothetical protein
MDSRTEALVAALNLSVTLHESNKTPGELDQAERVFDEACRAHARALDETQGVKPRVAAEDPDLLEEDANEEDLD